MVHLFSQRSKMRTAISTQQSAVSRVAAPRAQFIKPADYDPAFRSCTQSGHRVVGASGHRKKKNQCLLGRYQARQYRRKRASNWPLPKSICVAVTVKPGRATAKNRLETARP